MFIENVDILIIKTQKSACEQKKITVKGWRMLCSGFKATFCLLQCVCKDMDGTHFVGDLILKHSDQAHLDHNSVMSDWHYRAHRFDLYLGI